ncbi:MAG: SCO family protein [Alphaproteobacteria bacterium]|nr:SCO family protein [Alphaproteobacteria bacterium]
MRIVAAAALIVASWITAAVADARDQAPSIFDRDAAISYSQAAIGRSLSDYAFLDRDRKPRRLADFRGKPLVVNMVYTGCIYSCPVVVQSLYDAIDVAGEAIGNDAFRVVTIGFDAQTDTPERMRAYADSHGIDAANWEFLSTDADTARQLADELGFVFAESPVGFEHIAQTSVVDTDGRVYQHVYGANFEPPALVEPLKALFLSQPTARPSIESLVERIRLFCTNYDPSSGRYQFDYSIFFMLVIGGASLLGMLAVAARAGWRTYRAPLPPHRKA